MRRRKRTNRRSTVRLLPLLLELFRVSYVVSVVSIRTVLPFVGLVSRLMLGEDRLGESPRDFLILERFAPDGLWRGCGW